jgi:pilus assembly protein CpaF
MRRSVAGRMEPGEDVFERLRANVLDVVREENREALRDPAGHSAYLENVAMLVSKEMREDVPAEVCRKVVEDLLGYGPLNKVLTAPGATEVIVASYDRVFIEQNGVLKRDKNLAFRSEKHLSAVLHKIAMVAGRRLDRNCPTVDARLPDGTRVMITIPSLALRGASANFRRFPSFYPVERLVEKGALTGEVLAFIVEVQKAGLNMVITGPMGSGKTTLLNALIDLLETTYYPEVSVVVYEDIAELNPSLANVRQFEARPKDIEGKGEISLKDLVQTQMVRTRADWFVLGEMRGKETFYVLGAMTLGHSAMSTFHSHEVHEAVNRRLPKLYLMNKNGAAAGLAWALDEISYAVDVVIQMAKVTTRDAAGTRVERKVVQVAEVLQKENPATGFTVPDVRVLFEWDGCRLAQVAQPRVFGKKKRWC